jgi:hypothetical protein
MKNLDTVNDFAEYLGHKENWIYSGKDIIAEGEEDLLAHYLCNIDSTEENPLGKGNANKDYLYLGKNYWKQFEDSLEFKTKKALDKNSYWWDDLIEQNFDNIKNGTSVYISKTILNNPDSLYGFLVSLSRLERRVLADSFFEIVQNNSLGALRTRSVPDLHVGYPFFFFLIVDYGKFNLSPDQDPIALKRNLLSNYLYIQKYLYPTYDEFLGLVLSTVPWDFVLGIEHIDSKSWNSQDYEYLNELVEEFKNKGLLPKPHISIRYTNDYRPPKDDNFNKGRFRNFPCSCGSGKKYKHCCGKVN